MVVLAVAIAPRHEGRRRFLLNMVALAVRRHGHGWGYVYGYDYGTDYGNGWGTCYGLRQGHMDMYKTRARAMAMTRASVVAKAGAILYYRITLHSFLFVY